MSDFSIHPLGPLSNQFLQLGLTNFSSACAYVRALPYARNSDKFQNDIVLQEGFGTCSTKHALLAELALEQEVAGMRLILGVFMMHGQNTPRVASILATHQLAGIPEAHTYLRSANTLIDCTGVNFSEQNFLPDLIREIEIVPKQIREYKPLYHQQFIESWLAENPEIPYTMSEIWTIREACIAALAQ
ncbi:MAG: hypothetical protein ACRCYO_07575 [Bacteroidia bacterium]